MIFEKIILTDICMNIWKEIIIKIFSPSIANLRCTPRGKCTPGWEPYFKLCWEHERRTHRRVALLSRYRQARSHGRHSGTAPRPIFCAPQILLCPKNFLSNNKNKNVAPLTMYFEPPNLKTGLRPCYRWNNVWRMKLALGWKGATWIKVTTSVTLSRWLLYFKR